MDGPLTGVIASITQDWRFWSLAVLACGGLTVFVARSIGQRRLAFSDYDKRAITDVYRGLRSEALSWKPSDIGLIPTGDAYGVVMDWGRPGGIATVTSFNSGDASLYLSTGGGVLGGVAHEPVRKAALSFVAEAAKRIPWMSPASEFPLPKIGWAYFHVLTGRGVFSTLVRVEPVERNYEPVWQAAQLVIAALRESLPGDAKQVESDAIA